MTSKNVLIIIFLFLNTIASATDYYISSAGNDTNNGLSSSTPWKSITKVNSAFSTFKPGDRVLFKRGDTFYGTLKISSSGASGNPIVISAYGTGQNPIITGFTTLSSWTNEGGNVYSESVTSEAQTNMVIVDGVQVAMGRYPDAGTNLSFQSHSANVSITDINTQSSVTNWTGAEVVIHASGWDSRRSSITNHSAGTITYTQLSGTNLSPDKDNKRFFIQNDIRCLTSKNEWYHNTSDRKLYIYGNPAAKVIKMATLNYIIDFSGYSYITVDRLNIQGSILRNLNGNITVNNYITINNCNISYAGDVGIYLDNNDHVLIDSDTISYCNNQGMRIAHSTNATITNNYIHHIGVIEGQAAEETQYTGITLYQPTASGLVQYNKVEYTGYNGICSTGNSMNFIIANNFINYAMQIFDDGGAIYTGNSSSSSRTIQNNIVLNSGVGNPYNPQYAEGIYIDEYGDNILVDNNTVANCTFGRGYLIHMGKANTHTNNTSYNNKQGFCYNNSTSITTINNNILTGNVIIAKDATQLVLFVQSGANDLLGFFSSADYNYYARPIDDNLTFYTNQPSGGGNYRTFAGWQAFIGQDANSHKSQITITNTNDIRFEYNATKTNKIITLDQPMIDIRGTKYFDSITLSAFTSAVLMVDPNPANRLPVITIFNPSKGNKYEKLATITIDAVASDPDGTISKVEFYSGMTKLVELTSAPYSYTWKNVEPGIYSITALATDNLNATTTSSPIEIEVGVSSNFDANSDILNLYPNPNDGHFSIEFINPLQNGKSEVVITDLAGKQVYNSLVSKEDFIKQIDLSYIKPGIYILMIIYKKILVKKKFIKN